MEDLELLKAIMAVAAADGKLLRAEMGVARGLAERVGVGTVSFEAMLDTARQDESFADNILIRSKAKARSALELLVGLARIDGRISEEERAVIVRVAMTLGITGDEFERIYLAGIARADELRRSRKAAPR
ncbi:MAG: TerB family tellurite resistance protein [Planctomycetes bacterium]|nr:TerB family tellurite resistance protein [Planctomycetota bacterium]